MDIEMDIRKQSKRGGDAQHSHHCDKNDRNESGKPAQCDEDQYLLLLADFLYVKVKELFLF